MYKIVFSGDEFNEDSLRIENNINLKRKVCDIDTLISGLNSMIIIYSLINTSFRLNKGKYVLCIYS